MLLSDFVKSRGGASSYSEPELLSLKSSLSKLICSNDNMPLSLSSIYETLLERTFLNSRTEFELDKGGLSSGFGGLICVVFSTFNMILFLSYLSLPQHCYPIFYI